MLNKKKIHPMGKRKAGKIRKKKFNVGFCVNVRRVMS